MDDAIEEQLASNWRIKPPQHLTTAGEDRQTRDPRDDVRGNDRAAGAAWQATERPCAWSQSGIPSKSKEKALPPRAERGEPPRQPWRKRRSLKHQDPLYNQMMAERAWRRKQNHEGYYVITSSAAWFR